MTKTVQYQNELHKFLIWDTAGQERFRALAPMYYRGSAAAIIVYDITKEETFSTLKNWVRELRQHGPPSIVVAIAGNKCDLTDVREVMERDAKDYADSIHAIFVETSAKNAININELFIEISRRIPSTDANPASGGKGFKLRRQPSEPKRSCCWRPWAWPWWRSRWSWMLQESHACHWLPPHALVQKGLRGPAAGSLGRTQQASLSADFCQWTPACTDHAWLKGAPAAWMVGLTGWSSCKQDFMDYL